MSSEPVATPTSWPALTVIERRVLGVLVEKAKTTAESYPLSLNALTTGCNQKSNRDPILSVSDVEAEDTLLDLEKRGLVSKIIGGRVERWRHNLYEAWHLDKVELAILAELLLRGPQTEGELRGRASRMEPIDDLEALRQRLRPLADRRLVIYLTPENRRGTVLTHGFHTPEELAHLRTHTTEGPVMSTPAANTDLEHRLTKAMEEIEALRQRVERLENRVPGP